MLTLPSWKIALVNLTISRSLELLRVTHNYGECCVFCVNFLFLFK